ncbi:MAG: cyclic nucleotide-binding domain-containing protein [Legionellaceae bacterium]|nr:cyclic nucleotide-binding domain-containing protein [Legionellaceae bacterium]
MMPEKTIFLFRDLDGSDLKKLQDISRKEQYAAGEVLIEEGQWIPALYVVLSGDVVVRKRLASSDASHNITTLSSGDTVGEMSLVEEQTASASVIALNEVTVQAFPLRSLKAMQSGAMSAVFLTLCRNIAKELNRRLRYTTEITVQSLQQELMIKQQNALVMRFFIVVLIGILLYTVSLGLAIRHLPTVQGTSIISIPFILLFAFFLLYFCKSSQLSAAFFGITTRNWRFALHDCLRFTVPVLLALTAMKWLIIENMSQYAQEPLFNPHDFLHPQYRTDATLSLIMLYASLYAIFAVIQEFLARGILQSSLDYFLSGKYKTWTAIILANVIFSVVHIHLSGLYAFVVFFPGLLWGWMYARSQTLIGVSISHISIGLWAGFVLGFNFILRPI